jgi:capsular polysaccharide biosynthesis protein
VISLRHWWEWSYFHFWVDVLGKLSLLASAGLDIRTTPLLLGRYATELAFPRQIIGRGDLASFNWVLADDYVAADEAYYCRTLRPYRERLDFVMDLLKIDPKPTGRRSLFLSRRKASTRRIANHDEVAKLLRDYGFEEIDPEEMSVDDQITTFSQASRVVAVHGAGLINVMFRRSSPLDVLELSGMSYGNADFATLCGEFGYRWSGCPGTPVPGLVPQHADFVLHPDELRRALDVAFH